MGLYSIIAPEAGTNLVLNPSAEQPGNFANHNGATVTQSLTHARYGAQCYSIVTGATNRGVNLTLQALANAIHYVTFYARRDSVAFGGALEVSLNGGTNYNAAAIISGALADSGSRWVRVGVQISAAQANGSTACIIRNTANETFYVDAVQVEQNTVPTTYIDGDRTGLYRWNGLRAGSTSTRDAQERGGGRERDLATDYGIIVDPATQNYGYPETTLNFFPQPLQPGSLFQSDKLGMRELILQLTFGVTTGPAVTYQSMLQQRKNFLALVRGAQYRGRQPFILRSTAANANKPLYAPFRYKDGMRGGPQSGFSEKTPVHIVGEQPFWFEDDNQVSNLSFNTTITPTNGAARISGAWQLLGSGLNNQVYAIAVDDVRNRVYYGGLFTTANGVTVNGVGYWNGTTFVALGSGTVGVSGGAVRCIAIAPNGDVWVGGEFTSAGGSTTHGIARWNNSTNSWTVFTLAVGSRFYSLAISPSNILYGAGNFQNWNGDAAQDFITSYNGSTWSALGTSPYTTNNYPQAAHALAIDGAGVLWVGSQSIVSGEGGTVRKWNGSTWTLVVSTNNGINNRVSCLLFAPDGDLFVSGLFTTLAGVSASNIAAMNPSTGVVTAMGDGSGAFTEVMKLFSDGTLLAPYYNSTTALQSLRLWNGTAWVQYDMELATVDVLAELAITGQDDVFIGGTIISAMSISQRTTVTPISTTETFPLLYFVGPTSGSLTLRWLENQSTGDRLYFNLTVQSGETITIDLRPGRRQIVSDWRGAINTQPLAGSDFASFELLPGANTLAVFATGTLTGASLRMHYQPVHDSIDGVA